ncbi:hypothetical protein [Streptomyces sp. WZ-12]|uniref:hypothetical protein n=1 Tax=Streptomyces sp. WZ-12 TaxID=3030210 RepID=UPI0023814359|nr:hypothetical protein [Streptomyces sp. WZ-12]
MPDLLWDDVRDFFDPELMGALPDVSVTDASVDDWQAVFDLVRSSGWTWGYSEGCVRMPLPPAQEVLSRPTDADTAVLKVWPVTNVQVNFWPMSAGEVDFDVDLRELQGQEGVDVLCGLLGTIGRRLGRPVLMTGQGDRGNPVLGFDPVVDRVVLLADPLGVRLTAAAGGDS